MYFIQKQIQNTEAMLNTKATLDIDYRIHTRIYKDRYGLTYGLNIGYIG